MTKYQHTLVYWIDGIHLGAQEGEVELITEPVAGFRAVLSTDPDAYCFESDRFIALANLKLNALFGQLGLEITEESLADELEVLREARRRRFGSGPYLVFVREDNVEEFSRVSWWSTKGSPPPSL
jgi:hypothetical protein